MILDTRLVCGLTVAVLVGMAGLVCGSGCAEDTETDFEETDGYVPYQTTPEDSVIVTGEADYVGPTEAVTGDDTVVVAGEPIDEAEGKFCSDPEAKMDVIVVDGEVVDIICYPTPTEENMTTVAEQKGDTEVPQNANNTVIVFAPDTDGQIIEGDIAVDGNNVAIYGNGEDKTVVQGDIVISGNNARVRGLRVKGNVILDYNDTALLFCTVEGNVEVRKNNVTVAATTVLGDLSVLGNNAVLVQNRIQGAWDVVGSEHFCDGNLSFEDADGDLTAGDDEVGEQLSCE